MELNSIWDSLEEVAKADLLNVARGLQRRQQSAEHAN